MSDANEMNAIYPNAPTEPTKAELSAAAEEDGNKVLNDLVNAEIKPPSKAEEEKPEAEVKATADKKTAEEAKVDDAGKKIEPASETAELDPAFKGIIGDLRTERAKRQHLEQQLAEMNDRLEELRQAKTSEKQWDEQQMPTSEEAIAAKYKLADDDTLTVAQYKELRANQKAKAEFESQRTSRTATADQRKQQALLAAEQEFRGSVDAKLTAAGLTVDAVVTQENTLNLTGADWKKFYQIPAGSVERAKFLYDTIIDRTPDLKAKKSALSVTQPLVPNKPKEPKPAAIPKGSKSARETVEEKAEAESEQFRELVGKSDEELDALLKESVITAA